MIDLFKSTFASGIAITILLISHPLAAEDTATAIRHTRYAPPLAHAYDGGEILLLVHFSVTCFMTGVMWFVQLAYYPNMSVVGEGNYERYEKAHIRRINVPAWTMMTVELITAIVLLPLSQSMWQQLALAVNLSLLLLIWCSTFFVQVPLHKQLAGKFSFGAHLRLVRTNWLRTIAYTFRVALLWTVLFRIYSEAMESEAVLFFSQRLPVS